jgi:hypothetical protein
MMTMTMAQGVANGLPKWGETAHYFTIIGKVSADTLAMVGPPGKMIRGADEGSAFIDRDIRFVPCGSLQP